MPITDRTLRLLTRLRATVGDLADNTVRDLTRAWTAGWVQVAPAWQAAAVALVDAATRLGRWPTPVEIARDRFTADAITATGGLLDQLAALTTERVTGAAAEAVTATADAQPLVIAAQFPATLADQAAARAAGLILPTALAVITTRVQQAIVTQTRPLSAEALNAVRRELVRGVDQGVNPRLTARRIVQAVNGAFEGGLTRALTIARTEILDAHRVAAAYAHQANADVLDGWTWVAAVIGPGATRTCPSCWAMHGRVFPLDQAGPWDHPQGRCTRAPKVKPWSALGIDLDEPDDLLPDARTAFNALPRADQVQVMGAARLAMLTDGRIGWDDLPALRDNPGWRPSYVPRPVRDLQRIADRKQP